MSTVLQVTNVEKYYGNKGSLTKALDDISFSVENGEFVVIIVDDFSYLFAIRLKNKFAEAVSIF